MMASSRIPMKTVAPCLGEVEAEVGVLGEAHREV